MFEKINKIGNLGSSGQDGGIGRNLSLPCTIRRRITTNLKSVNQKCQKIKLHGTPTTKELKKKSARTTRLVRIPMVRPRRWGWLKAKLRLRADCGLWQGLPQWGKLPVSHESSLESGARDEQGSCTVPSLARSPQDAPAAQQGGLPCTGEYLRP